MGKWIVTEDITIKEAMFKLKEIGERTLFVVSSKGVLKGSLSDGDIRRWIISKGNINKSIKKAYNRKPIFYHEQYDLEQIKKKFITKKIEAIPIVNHKKEVINVLTWDKVFSKDKIKINKKVRIKGVIMAGGEGTRLDPVTRILPKPLMPIGDKSVIEHIIERLNDYGIKDFYVSIHHKAKLIKAYFEEQNLVNIKFIEEKIPLGTAGSLSLLRNHKDKRFLVTNCDILLDVDIEDLLKFHKKEKFDMTIVVSCKNYTLPYGVCEIEAGGKLSTIKEKPVYNLLVNTGMYVINREILKIIPKNKKYGIDNLIDDSQKNGFTIGVYPINDKSWIDIGQWDGYGKVLNPSKHQEQIK